MLNDQAIGVAFGFVLSEALGVQDGRNGGKELRKLEYVTAGLLMDQSKQHVGSSKASRWSRIWHLILNRWCWLKWSLPLPDSQCSRIDCILSQS